MSTPRITLDQWRALQAVVEAGGYAQAAAAIHKSQSTITYAVQKIQRLLGVEIFEIRGRKAVLTEPGQVLYRRARMLLEEAGTLERGAAEMAADWKPEIRIAVEILYPSWLLLECLAEFARERPETRIEVYETVMGTDEMLARGEVDLAIGSQFGAIGASLMTLRALAFAHPGHPLHLLGRPLTERDLRGHRRIFIRETGSQRQREVQGVELRWTVTNKATSIRGVAMGLAFAWFPEEWVAEEVRAGTLKALPMKGGVQRSGQLYLAVSDPEFPSRDVARLAQIISTRTAERCVQRRAGRPRATDWGERSAPKRGRAARGK